MEIVRKGARTTLSLQIEESEGFGDFDFMFGDADAPEPPDDSDFEFFGPGDSDSWNFRLPDIGPQLRKFRIELDGMRRNLERQIKDQLEKVRVVI